MSSPERLARLQEKIWRGSIPLYITLAKEECKTYDESFPYLTQCPRLSYLPFLLERLHDFYANSLIDPDVPFYHGWFSFDDVPLKWQHPVGLLYDLFSGATPTNADGSESKRFEPQSGDGNNGHEETLPWRLVLHFTEWPFEHLIPLDEAGKVIHDAFINSVKEADFLRNGTAKVIMSLSKDDSTMLWQAVKDHNMSLFNSIYQKFLYPSGGLALRHVPIKVYLPTAMPPAPGKAAGEQARGSLKVVQTLVPPMISTKEARTLGTALHDMLPTVFPSRRSYIYAQAVLHGAVLPLAAPVQDLMRLATYADGFLHIAVVMVS